MTMKASTMSTSDHIRAAIKHWEWIRDHSEYGNFQYFRGKGSSKDNGIAPPIEETHYVTDDGKLYQPASQCYLCEDARLKNEEDAKQNGGKHRHISCHFCPLRGVVPEVEERPEFVEVDYDGNRNIVYGDPESNPNCGYKGGPMDHTVMPTAPLSWGEDGEYDRTSEWFKDRVDRRREGAIMALGILNSALKLAEEAEADEE